MNTKILFRIFLIFISIHASITVSAQQIVMRGDTMIVNNDAKFWLNQILYFGSGTMPDKTYSYIYEAPNSIQKIINNHRKKLLGAGYRGFKCKVVKFEKEVGKSKKGSDYTILVLEMPDGRRFWCDAVNAYGNNEIVFKAPENKGTDVTKSDDGPKPDAPKKSTPKKSKSSKTTTPVSVF